GLERDDVRVVVADGERGVEARAERGAGAAVLAVRDELRRHGAAVALDPFGGAVARAVIDDEEPAARREQLRPRLEVLEQARQVLDLVERGNDEQVRNTGAGAGVLPPRRVVRRAVTQLPCACNGTHAADLP